MDPLITQIIGYAAASVGTVIMLPQALRTFRTKKARDVSLMMLVAYLVNCALWSAYGLLISSMPVLLCNILAFFISVAMLAMKAKFR